MDIRIFNILKELKGEVFDYFYFHLLEHRTLHDDEDEIRVFGKPFNWQDLYHYRDLPLELKREVKPILLQLIDLDENGFNLFMDWAMGKEAELEEGFVDFLTENFRNDAIDVGMSDELFEALKVSVFFEELIDHEDNTFDLSVEDDLCVCDNYIMRLFDEMVEEERKG